MESVRKLLSCASSPGRSVGNSMESVRDSMRATIYGNCIGDAIGILTEFMGKKDAAEFYGKKAGKIEYKLKVDDRHRMRWEAGDWTDDGDQMILIMQSLLDNDGQVNTLDYAKKIKHWQQNGFEELGDKGGLGIGTTTVQVLIHPKFLEDPHAAANDIWVQRKGVAPNGGVMRTSAVGLYMYNNIEAVIQNTLQFCKITHADHRCQASCVAVTTAIAQMLQRKHLDTSGRHDADKIMEESFQYAKEYLLEEQIQEFRDHMFAETIDDLKLDEGKKIGYTLKTMGAGFWAFRQNNFRLALETVLFEGGDADTNGAVAGALLGCKLGVKALPKSWLSKLVHKNWLDEILDRFIELIESKLTKSVVEKTAEKDTENQESVQNVNKEQEASVQNGNQEQEIIQNGNQEQEIVQNGNQEQESVQNGNQEQESVQNGNQEPEFVQNGDQEQEPIQNSNKEQESVQNGNQELKLVQNDNQEQEIVQNGNQEQELVQNDNQKEEQPDDDIQKDESVQDDIKNEESMQSSTLETMQDDTQKQDSVPDDKQTDSTGTNAEPSEVKTADNE